VGSFNAKVVGGMKHFKGGVNWKIWLVQCQNWNMENNNNSSYHINPESTTKTIDLSMISLIVPCKITQAMQGEIFKNIEVRKNYIGSSLDFLGEVDHLRWKYKVEVHNMRVKIREWDPSINCLSFLMSFSVKESSPLRLNGRFVISHPKKVPYPQRSRFWWPIRRGRLGNKRTPLKFVHHFIMAQIGTHGNNKKRKQ
jgi:hypothetical protein